MFGQMVEYGIFDYGVKAILTQVSIRLWCVSIKKIQPGIFKLNFLHQHLAAYYFRIQVCKFGTIFALFENCLILSNFCIIWPRLRRLWTHYKAQYFFLYFELRLLGITFTLNYVYSHVLQHKFNNSCSRMFDKNAFFFL